MVVHCVDDRRLGGAAAVVECYSCV
jgi:hypothetical protein